MAYTATFDRYMAIDGVPLNTPAWQQTNLQEMFSYANLRGDNRVIPGAIGVRPLRKRPTETNRTVNLYVFGDLDWEGTVRTDPEAGLYANLNHLVTNVVNPLATTNSVRTAILHTGAGTLTTSLQVLGFEVGEALTPWCVAASMDVTFIDGGFW